MNASLFPFAVILVLAVLLLVRIAWRALMACAGMAADRITLWRLAQLHGSRARANRIVRAVELETRTNALYPLARFPVPSRSVTAAGAVGRSSLFTSPVPQRKLIVGSVTR